MPEETQHPLLDELKQAGIAAIENEVPEAIEWALGLIRKFLHLKKSAPPATASDSNPNQPPPPNPPGHGG